jgi:GntR family transcriptional repressor for pyruvate dehydrogenase complex
MSSAPVQRGRAAISRLHQHVMAVLVNELAAGEPGTGERLARESDLAVRFGVSRGVVREALRGLEERGMIEVRPGLGAIVLPRRDWNILDATLLGAMLSTSESADLLSEYLETRRILEIEAAGLAAERARGEDLAAIGDALAQMHATAEGLAISQLTEDLWHAADVAFHRGIFVASGNRVFWRITEPIHRALATARRPLAQPATRYARTLPEHGRILNAIASRDPEEARAAMRAHLDSIGEYLREYVETQYRAPPPPADQSQSP